MPVGLNLITGNHLEVLAKGLAEVLHADTGDSIKSALQPEIVVVQSKGMERWLSMAIARNNGICANISFPFPNAFLEMLFSRLTGKIPLTTPFETSILTYRIMAVLPQLLPRHEFKPLRIYLSNASHPLKDFQLAKKIADLFDQYQIFRPDMILAWEAFGEEPSGAHESWQAILWRELTDQQTFMHRATLHHELMRRFEATDDLTNELPDRVAVFGISYLPPFHLQVVASLARHIPVYLFLLNPCRQFWSYIQSSQQMLYSRKRSAATFSAADDLHFESGNPLLASWGQQGKYFFNLIQQFDADTTEVFTQNPHPTLLGCIQQDILELERRDELEDKKPVINDGSLRINVCHSMMREVEVLYDHLLDIFDHNTDIQPRDVLVMTPDISVYAPYVHAVFGANRQIPFSVTDQHIRGESRLVEGFMQILGLKDSRFETSQVMMLLEFPDIRRRFGIEVTDLPILTNWVRQANIRWAWDADTRKEMGLPAFEANTWRRGMDGLLLGYAMTGGQNRVFNAILPIESVEGSLSRKLGCLIEFAESLHTHLAGLPAYAPLVRWAALLHELLGFFFQPEGASLRDAHMLRSLFEQIADIEEFTKDAQEFEFDIIHQHLVDALHLKTQNAGFITGGVTFCAMLPMRSIPAKVICMLGMDHNAFPREVKEPGFNIMSAAPRAGDRSKRNDDMYLFLESLISARHTLYLSYIGRSIQDNAAIPPSVVIDELLDYIEGNCGVRRNELVCEHPLHAFSPAYFNGSHPALFSYSHEDYKAGQRMTADQSPEPFISESLPPVPASWRHCEISRLTQFWKHPARYLLEQRLGIFLRQSEQAVEDREHFNLNALDRFRLAQYMLNAHVNEISADDVYDALRASGSLPHGNAGKAIFRQMQAETRQFERTIKSYLSDRQPFQATVWRTVGNFHVQGTIENIYPQARISFRMANLRPQDLLDLFINHLAMHLCNEVECPKRSVLICKDAVWEMGPLPDAVDILKTHLNYYWQGLQQPLLFFPQSSFIYAQKRLIHDASRNTALVAARRKWYGNEFYPGESQDLNNKRCFEDIDPLTDDFEQTAMTIFRPILNVGVKKPAST